MLFQFSNRVGALLSYTIIEALRPTEILKLLLNRQKIAIEFVRDTISPEYLSQTFLASLPYDFRDKNWIGPWEIITDNQGQKRRSIKNGNEAPEINQLYVSKNQNPLQDLINAYNRVYPHFHDLLDRDYRKYVNRDQEWSTCNHLWKVISIHKIGVGLKCHKCFRIMSEDKFQELLGSGQEKVWIRLLYFLLLIFRTEIDLLQSYSFYPHPCFLVSRSDFATLITSD